MKCVVAENEKQLREEIEAKRQKIGEPGEKVKKEFKNKCKLIYKLNKTSLLLLLS